MKTFRYHQWLQRGDLAVRLTEGGNPITPFQVTFTAFRKRPDGSRYQVGPSDRTPVQGGAGEFYVTGRAGEAGQPGDWVIVWKYVKSFGADPQTVEQPFVVQDAVAAQDPLDLTVRAHKCGWD